MALWPRRSVERKPERRGRRSGPPDEAHWWDEDDQALAELLLLDARTLGRGWRGIEMVNNVERLDPLGDDEASIQIRAERSKRRPTALDEGRAWRHHDGAALVVVRFEVFADPDPSSHRQAWSRHAVSSLEATWKQRWRERGQDPGWVEARPVTGGDRPEALRPAEDGDRTTAAAASVDWFRIEDHTDPTGRQQVSVYEHLTVWHGRDLVTITVRHPYGQDLAEVAAGAATAVHQRLDGR